MLWLFVTGNPEKSRKGRQGMETSHHRANRNVTCLVRRALRHASDAQTPNIPVFVGRNVPHHQPPDR